MITVEESGILLDWSNWVNFHAPDNATILGYHVSRCIADGCVFVTDSPFPWGTPSSNNGTSETSIFDAFNWDPGVAIKYAINVKYANAEEYGMAIGASYITPCAALGDVSGDGLWNVLDIVQLANCVLAETCEDTTLFPCGCAAELSGDGLYNVLDIVQLANCVLAETCGGRIDDASESHLIMKDNMVSIEADGFIGGVQMTLSHGDEFSITMTDRALFADYLTAGNTTRLIVITPETDELFSYSGDFEIVETIVANSYAEIPAEPPVVASFSLSEAYPNPFNPTATMELTMPVAGDMQVEVYNLLGQSVSTLTSGYKDAGTYSLTWDATHAASGVYFVKAQAEGFTKIQKLMLVK